MKKAILQAVNLVAPICRIAENTSGMISCVAPPPRFPHPAAIPLAEPTTGPENIELIQNCVETKVASENPAKNRTMINPIGDLIPDVKYTAGAVESVNAAEARRGPKRSQAVPMTRRAKTEPDTEAIPAFPMSVAVRLRFSRMTGRRGGAAKVETKQQKNWNHERWKALMWGLATEKRRNVVDLFSESTGSANLRVVVVRDSSPLPSTSIACELWRS